MATYNPTTSACSCGNWCAYPGGCWRSYGDDDPAEATYADHNDTEKPKCNCARKSGPHGWGSKCQDFDLKQKSKSKGRAKESSGVKIQAPSSTSMKKSSHGKGKHSYDQGCACGLGCVEGSGCRYVLILAPSTQNCLTNFDIKPWGSSSVQGSML